MIVFIFILLALIFICLYILLSKQNKELKVIKDKDEFEKLFASHNKNSYQTVTEVFKTLYDADLCSCLVLKKSKSGFDCIWAEVIKTSIDRCIAEVDNEFKKETGFGHYEINKYKSELMVLYERKREWLKKKYLRENDPILDFHKLSGILCRCVIGTKPFYYNAKKAVIFFDKINNDTSIEQDKKIKWEIDNIYVNYKLAFLIGEGIILEDLLYWGQNKINNLRNYDIRENTESIEIQVYESFVKELYCEKKLKNYEVSNPHDDFITSFIIALMKNDYLMRDFDYLLFSSCMFQWQEYTKNRILYKVLLDKNIKKDPIDFINKYSG